MSNQLTRQDEWDPANEAAKAFGLTDDVKAVVFTSDVAVANAVRGKTRRKQDSLFNTIRQFLAEGSIEKARLSVEQAVWPGPRTVHWLTTVQELTQLIEEHDAIIHRKRIAAGLSVVESLDDPRVVFFDLWWDR